MEPHPQEVAEYMKKRQNGEQVEAPKQREIVKPQPDSNEMFLDLMRKLVDGLNLNRAELASRAFLISAVSSFEILFAHVVRSVYDRNPAALNQSEYAFTLQELAQYASIDEARAALVARKVDALLMESVDSWSKWLERAVNTEFTTVAADWPIVREVFARRNILVHADGLVTARYIRDLQSVSADITSLTVGDRLPLSTTYVQESLERLIALGLMLVCSVWTRLYKAEKSVSASWLSSSQEDLIRRELWLAAHLISHSVKQASLPRKDGLALQVNGWLA
jgi:hypothetical protein